MRLLVQNEFLKLWTPAPAAVRRRSQPHHRGAQQDAGAHHAEAREVSAASSRGFTPLVRLHCFDSLSENK